MIKQVFFIAIILFFGACQNVKYPKKPKNLIPKDTMVSIFTDSYITNAAKGFNKGMMQRKGIVLENFLYKKYHIDSLQFEESNAYYTANLDEYHDIFDSVQKRIELNLKRVDSVVDVILAEEKRVKDSLREAKEKRRDSTKTKKIDTIIPPVRTGRLLESSRTLDSI